MNTIIIAKMSCDDSILKASQKFGAEEVKDMVSAAFSFTPFSVMQTELVCARVSEKYYSACKKLGYDYGFFREYTVMVLCCLNQCSTSDFDGVYIPFSGEIYLIPKGVWTSRVFLTKTMMLSCIAPQMERRNFRTAAALLWSLMLRIRNNPGGKNFRPKLLEKLCRI